jgi:hypothetical protein
MAAVTMRDQRFYTLQGWPRVSYDFGLDTWIANVLEEEKEAHYNMVMNMEESFSSSLIDEEESEEEKPYEWSAFVADVQAFRAAVLAFVAVSPWHYTSYQLGKRLDILVQRAGEARHWVLSLSPKTGEALEETLYLLLDDYLPAPLLTGLNKPKHNIDEAVQGKVNEKFALLTAAYKTLTSHAL